MGTSPGLTSNHLTSTGCTHRRAPPPGGVTAACKQEPLPKRACKAHARALQTCALHARPSKHMLCMLSTALFSLNKGVCPGARHFFLSKDTQHPLNRPGRTHSTSHARCTDIKKNSATAHLIWQNLATSLLTMLVRIPSHTSSESTALSRHGPIV